MRYGLVTGFGRSGSTWLAHALNRCTLIRADHESLVDPVDFCKCRVEVNTYWTEDDRLERFAGLYPDAVIVHLVRDPRAVIRSAMSRATGKVWGFEKCCSEWARRVLYAEQFAHLTVSLETLTDPDAHLHRVNLCSAFGAIYDPQAWRPELGMRHNETGTYEFPAFDEWGADERRIFDAHCGPALGVVGYLGRAA